MAVGRPDVRVRLSAEGVAEVVSALKRVQTEGTKTAAKGKTGFKGLNNVLGNTKALIGGIGIALGVRYFMNFVRGGLEAADSMNKLGLRVGATTENLSALSLIARTADSSLGQLGKGLNKMNRYIAQVGAGNVEAMATFEDLGIKIKDMKGMDAVETFELLAKAIVDLPTVARRADAAMKVMGKSGSELLNTMEALATEGLDAVIERAGQLGVLISSDIAGVSERIKDDMEILKMQSEAMGANFMAGFGPELSRVLQTMTGGLGDAGKAWETFGTGVGTVLKYVVGIVAEAADIITGLLGMIGKTSYSVGKIVGSAILGDMEGIKNELNAHQKIFDSTLDGMVERAKGRFGLVLTPPSPTPPLDPKKVAAEQEAARLKEQAILSSKKATALQTSLDRELALVKSGAALKTKEEKADFEEGLQSLTTYYSDRRGIIDKRLADELAVIQQKRELLPDMMDPAIRLQEEKKIETMEAKAELEHETAVGDLIVENRTAVRDLAQERIGFEQELLRLKGEGSDADRLGFEERIRLMDVLLRQEGESDEVREAKLQQFRDSLEAGADFEDTKRLAKDALADLAMEKEAIEERAEAGLLNQITAEETLLGLEQERIEGLRELADLLLAAAEATGDPEKIAQAQTFAQSVSEIGTSIEASTDTWAVFKTTAIDATTDALAQFFEAGMTGAEGFKESIQAMGTAVLSMLSKMLAEFLAAELMKKALSFFNVGGEVGGDFIGPMPAGAGGGLFRGRGTRTSDSNLVWLSDREFVVRAAVTEQPGILRHLKDLNTRGTRALGYTPSLLELPTRRMSGGGLVAPSTLASPGGAPLAGRLTVGVEDGLVLREFDTPAGERIIVETLSKNRRKVRAALGV